MTSTPDIPIIEKVTDAIRDAKAIRLELPGDGRVHIDRPLPIIFVHCFDSEAEQLLARRIVTSNAVYLLVPETEWDSSFYQELVSSLESSLRAIFSEVLFVEVTESSGGSLLEDDAPTLPECNFKLLVPDRKPLSDVLATMAGAIRDASIDYHSPTTSIIESSHLADARAAPGGVETSSRQNWVGLAIPPIYRVAGGDSIYPEVFGSTVSAVFDALLKGAYCFATTRTSLRPSHHRALGRSVFDHLVSRFDAHIEAICGSYDFLLSVTPINADAAWTSFRDSQFQRRPELRYRPLTVAPDTLKRELFSLSLDQLEDPVLAALFEEKQQEIDHQLTLLQLRNTPGFRNMSAVLYGDVAAHTERAARSLLEELEPESPSLANSDSVGCEQLCAIAQRALEHYRREYDGFNAKVHIRDDIPPGLMVSGDCLLISRHTHMPANRVDALIQHEVGVHLLTHFNGSAQGLSILRSGLAGYEELQEGLGVFAEYAVGGLSVRRLRILAARVIACHAMLDGASFVETFRLLCAQWGFPERVAFNIALRVYRAGGLSKDAIYLRGLMRLLELLETGIDLDMLWMGKVAASHFPVIHELLDRGMLRKPVVQPTFLANPDAQRRIQRARKGMTLGELTNIQDDRNEHRILRQ